MKKMSTSYAGSIVRSSPVEHDKFYFGDRDNSKVYAVAVPSADFSVKSVKVFRSKEVAETYMNFLYRTGEQPELFETTLE